MSFYRRFLFSLVASTALLTSTHCFAANVFSIWSVPNVNFGSWNDAGTLVNTITGCIESYKNSSKKNYKLTLTGDGSGSAFYLYLNGDTSQTGTNRIQVDISVRDLFTKPNYDSLINGSETSARKGRLSGCPGGVNGDLNFVILESELAAATGGDFSGSFELSGRGGQNFNKNDSTTFQLSITVVAPQVKISGLQDMVFATDPTSAAGMTADETFCVYSGASDYNITISSSDYENGSFALASNSGEKVGIDLLYADNASGTGMQAVQPSVALTGSGDSSSNICNGSDNATLRVSVGEQTIREASSGNYAATITLLVEPI